MSAAYSSTAYGLTAPSSWKRRRSCPSLIELGGRALGGRAAHSGVTRARAASRAATSSEIASSSAATYKSAPRGSSLGAPPGFTQPGDPELPETTDLDHDALMQGLEPQARLEVDVVCRAQTGVGGPQAFACLARVALRVGQ